MIVHKGRAALKCLFREGPVVFARKMAAAFSQVFPAAPFSAVFQAHYEIDRDFSGDHTDIRALTFYLPQYHAFPENDAWWGKGFTEWINTKKARPAVPGHYQPREPHEDIGYYDLSDWHVLAQQAEMAKRHGIHGFCFYHYWFSGKRLMEKPVDQLLEHPEIDLDFCLCWANENWTRAWDGKAGEILIAQSHRDDDVQFIIDLKRYMDDPRYIRIDGKPFVLVYRPSGLPDPAKTFSLWKQWAEANGFPGLYIGVVRGCKQDAGTAFVEGADAEIEFPPAYCTDHTTVYTDPSTGAGFIDYGRYVRALVDGHGCVERFSHPVFRGCMLGWDCAARRKQFCAWTNFSIGDYSEWLRYLIRYTRSHCAGDRRFLFINAWNEWAEGTYLEPDKRFGYVYLNATSRALFDQAEPDTSEDVLKKRAEELGLFDAKWYLKKYPELKVFGGSAVDHYWKWGWKERRQPSAVFPAQLYVMKNPRLTQWPRNPLADFLASGRDESYLAECRKEYYAVRSDVRKRMRIREVVLADLFEDGPGVPVPPGSIGVHVHLFYADMLEQILSLLKNIPAGFDLYVSVAEAGIEEEIRRTCLARLPRLKRCEVVKTPNRGRDVAPLIRTFGERLKTYDYVCHIHTKKSLRNASLAGWSDFIFSHLLGSELLVTRILAWLSGDVSLVYPPDFLPLEDVPDKWGRNLELTEQLLKSAGIPYDLKKEFPVIEFSQGTMFWARGDYLARMLSVNLNYEDFPEEPIGDDGTVAHALERALLLWDPSFERDVVQLFLDKKDREEYSNERI